MTKFLIVLIASLIIFVLFSSPAPATAQWGGVYVPQYPGAPMWSYYTGDYGDRNHIHYGHHAYYTSPYRYSPSRHYAYRYQPRPQVRVYGSHGGVKVGNFRVWW